MTLEEAYRRFITAGKIDEAYGCIYRLYEEDKERASALLFEWRRVVRSHLREDLRLNMSRLRKSYALRAMDSLDDYMTYIEWEREPAKKFWLPRRKILLPVVKEIDRLCAGELDVLGISLPPGTGKSTLKTFMYSREMGKYPDRPNLDSGHSGMMTQSTYDGVLQILTDPEYLWGELFPGMKVITNAKELTIDLDKKHRFSTLTCRAIGASLTGATRCEGILGADDLVSGIEEAMSKDRLDKKWDAYANDLKSRKKLGAKELHIATRWSVHDVVGRLEREYAGDSRAKFIVVPALDADGNSNFDYDYQVGFDKKFFEDMRHSMDDASFKALYMGQPVEREGLLYEVQDLRRYYELPEGEPDVVLGVTDTAEGGGDDTVLPVFAVYGNDHYLIDGVCSAALPEVTDELCADAICRNKVSGCQFESNAAGGRTADKVAEKVKARGHHCNITKKRTTANKETKIIVESSWVKEHVLFPDDKVNHNKAVSEMISKLCSYTVMGKNKHDDVPDAFAQYSKYYQSMTQSRIEIVDRRKLGI